MIITSNNLYALDPDDDKNKLECILETPTKNCFWRHNQNGYRAHKSVIVQSEQQNQRPTTEPVFGWGRQNALRVEMLRELNPRHSS